MSWRDKNRQIPKICGMIIHVVFNTTYQGFKNVLIQKEKEDFYV